jgi:hypothetical protein
MKYVWIAAFALLVAQPAAAQVNLMGTMDKPVTSEDIEKKKAREQAYRESLKKIPEQKAANDPWGDVRSAETPAKGKAQQKR